VAVSTDTVGLSVGAAPAAAAVEDCGEQPARTNVIISTPASRRLEIACVISLIL
jgi:hypothetical protein